MDEVRRISVGGLGLISLAGPVYSPVLDTVFLRCQDILSETSYRCRDENEGDHARRRESAARRQCGRRHRHRRHERRQYQAHTDDGGQVPQVVFHVTAGAVVGQHEGGV